MRLCYASLGLALLATGTASAQSLSDAVRAYAWANNATSASYAPTSAYAYNATDGPTTITRSAVGVYAVAFDGLGSVANGGNVHVTAYGLSTTCNVSSWGNNGGSLRIVVRCYTSSGAPIDSRFNVLFLTSSGAAVSQLAYAYANNPSSASYTPSSTYSYNGGGGAITATRSGAGSYRMSFAGLSTTNGHVQVTAYGSSATCGVNSWSPSGGALNVGVRCRDAAGAPVDTRYTVMFIGNASATDDVGFAWANDADGASYTPSLTYSVNDGGAMTATRSAVGDYVMAFAGLGGVTSGGNVQVPAYSSDAARTVGSWSSTVDVRANIDCYDAAGARMDTRYNVLVVWPTRHGVASEEAPDGAFALAAFPNPSAGEATVRFRLDAPATVRLVVYDGLGREVGRLVDGTRSAGDHTARLDTEALVPGVYHVRLDADGRTATRTVTVLR